MNNIKLQIISNALVGTDVVTGLDVLDVKTSDIYYDPNYLRDGFIAIYGKTSKKDHGIVFNEPITRIVSATDTPFIESAFKEFARLNFKTAPGSSGVLSVDSDKVFVDTITRDTFFTNNPDSLIKNQLCVVGTDLQSYNGTEWVSISPVIKGDKGDDGDNYLDGYINVVGGGDDSGLVVIKQLSVGTWQEPKGFVCIIRRDATVGNVQDTLQADIILTHIKVNAFFWRP